MKRNDIYEKAFAMKAEKAWDQIQDRQLFAIQVRGQRYYVQLRGGGSHEYMLMIFIGDAGLKNCLDTSNGKNGYLEMRAAVCAHDGIDLFFAPKEQLTEDDQDEVRKYTKEHGISLRGKNAWPRFVRIVPFQPAETMENGTEGLEILGCAMDAAMWLCGKVKNGEFQIPEVTRDAESILFLRRELAGYSTELIPMPALPKTVYPVGKNANDLYKARVKQMKKKGTWACELIVCSRPAPAEGVEGLYFPWRLLTFDVKMLHNVQVQRVRDYENRTEVMLDKLMEAILNEGSCPKKIEVFEDRTQALLQEWCQEMKIELIRKEEKPEHLETLEMLEFMNLNDLVEESDENEEDHDWFDDDFEDDGEYGEYNFENYRRMMEMTLDFLDLMSDKDLLKVPGMVQEQYDGLRMILNLPKVPKNMRKRIEKNVQRMEGLISRETQYETLKAPKKKAKKKKNATPAKTFVISVSLDTGCYRHIRISSQALLVELSEAILDAFDFMNDHAHGFYMSNSVYDELNSYYVAGFDPDRPATNEVTLEDTGMKPGMKFKYLFDFGDEWVFQCRVLKELNEITDYPQVVRSKGEAPQQYADWWNDDDWDDDDEDWDEDDE